MGMDPKQLKKLQRLRKELDYAATNSLVDQEACQTIIASIKDLLKKQDTSEEVLSRPGKVGKGDKTNATQLNVVEQPVEEPVQEQPSEQVDETSTHIDHDASGWVHCYKECQEDRCDHRCSEEVAPNYPPAEDSEHVHTEETLHVLATPPNQHEEQIIEQNQSPEDEKHSLKLDNEEGEIKDKDKPMSTVVTLKGCLFACCTKCANMITVQFEDDELPETLTSSGDKDKDSNLILLTQCHSCGGRDVKKNIYASYDPDPRINPELMKDSAIVKAAELVSNTEVSFVVVSNMIKFMNTRELTECSSKPVRMRSMDLTKVENGNRDDVLLPYLLRSFL